MPTLANIFAGANTVARRRLTRNEKRKIAKSRKPKVSEALPIVDTQDWDNLNLRLANLEATKPKDLVFDWDKPALPLNPNPWSRPLLALTIPSRDAHRPKAFAKTGAHDLDLANELYERDQAYAASIRLAEAQAQRQALSSGLFAPLMAHPHLTEAEARRRAEAAAEEAGATFSERAWLKVLTEAVLTA